MWFTLLAAAAAVLVIILISPVTVEIKYTYLNFSAPGDDAPREEVPDRGVRIALFWGLVNLGLKLSSIRVIFRSFTPVLNIRARLRARSGSVLAREETRLSPARALALYRRSINIYRAGAPAFRYLLAGTALRRFRWSTGVGLADAGQTGMAVGGLWILKANAASLLCRMVNSRPVPKPELDVLPFFNGQVFKFSFDCIFSLRLGHIMYTGLLAGWHLLKNRTRLRDKT